jgi:hypothetical protein
MEIGKPIRTITVEPAQEPVPQRRETSPTRTPKRVPSRSPERSPEKAPTKVPAK